MKKLLLLLLFIPLVSFGQNNNSLDLNVSKGPYGNQFKARGMKNLGSGTYSVTQVGGSGFVSLKKLEKRARQEIIDFTNANSFTYKIINIEKQKMTVGIFPKVIITFKIKNLDGSVVLTKEEVKKELLSLKEYLDLGIITQEEFDKKAESLKKILLGN